MSDLADGVMQIAHTDDATLPSATIDLSPCRDVLRTGVITDTKLAVLAADRALDTVEAGRATGGSGSGGGGGGACDPNYSGCVPLVSYDLDCSSSGVGSNIQVIGYDKHGFDGDGDGVGCES